MKIENLSDANIKAYKLAQLLFQLIRERKKIEKPQFAKWTQDILMIHVKQERSFEEIEEWIRFSQNKDYIQDTYFPVVLCADSFRRKIPKLEIYKEKNIVKKDNKPVNHIRTFTKDEKNMTVDDRTYDIRILLKDGWKESFANNPINDKNNWVKRI